MSSSVSSLYPKVIKNKIKTSCDNLYTNREDKKQAKKMHLTIFHLNSSTKKV